MALNTDVSRGDSRISNRVSYRPYQGAQSKTQQLKGGHKDRASSSSNRVKCQSGYVLMHGRCMPQEQRNSQNNAMQNNRNKTIDTFNKRIRWN